MKIAIVGTAAHRNKAPFDDPAWAIWACSPGNIGQLPRWDEWFELHDIEAFASASDIEGFIAAADKPVWMQEKYAGRYEAARAFPFLALVARYGGQFFTSTVAWMLATALERKPAAIGLWGVDMAAGGEYRDQRWGCQHFLALARERGIEVHIPPESKLNVRPRLYGLEPKSAAQRDLERRAEQLRHKLTDSQRAAAMQEGALTVIEDILRAEYFAGATDGGA